ncbi:unnamed protein product [Peronospora belbahrii]|uniref:Secreted protein n=1 Tax=Peronospora belbahrii TaxID=622444 RepID=A0ABN8CPD1_9STRA|nr:unnamed protein product [Peronospora belbahrii]
MILSSLLSMAASRISTELLLFSQPPKLEARGICRGVEGAELLLCVIGAKLPPDLRAAASRFFRIISAKPPTLLEAILPPVLLFSF